MLWFVWNSSSAEECSKARIQDPSMPQMEKWTTCLRSFHADGQITAPLLYSQRNKLVQGIFRSRDALMAEKKWDGYSPASANRLLLYISPYVTTWELWSGKQCPNNCQRRLNSEFLPLAVGGRGRHKKGVLIRTVHSARGMVFWKDMSKMFASCGVGCHTRILEWNEMSSHRAYHSEFREWREIAEWN